jgi:hypothetical protein
VAKGTKAGQNKPTNRPDGPPGSGSGGKPSSAKSSANNTSVNNTSANNTSVNNTSANNTSVNNGSSASDRVTQETPGKENLSVEQREPVSLGIDALSDLRTARRKNRLQEIHWSDALYRSYVIVVAGGLLLGWASSMLGSEPVGPQAVADVARKGPALLGALIALLFGNGLRAGSRGGPLSIEAADLAHVLQAPLDRSRSLRRPYVHVLRRAVLQGIGIGGAAGVLAHPFLPGNAWPWMGAGALAGFGVSVGSVALASVASSWRMPKGLATGIAVGLLGWSIADVSLRTITSPLSVAGSAFLLPMANVRVHPTIGLAVLFGIMIVASALAWMRLGGTSMEMVERRTALVTQLRFAVSTQDLRTAMLLRRQLAAERSRPKPWVKIKGGKTPDTAVIVRGFRGLARWPGSRLARMVVGGLVAGVIGRAAWEGVLPLVILAGLVFFVLALDAIESLAQDADHPDLVMALPRHHGRLANRQTIVPGVIMAFVGILAGVGGTLSGALFGTHTMAASGGTVAVTLIAGIVAGIVAAVLAVAGAVLSVTLGPPSFMTMLQTPELAFGRSAISPAIALLGSLLPLLLVRQSMNAVKVQSPLPGLVQSVFASALICYLVITVLTSKGVTGNDRT